MSKIMGWGFIDHLINQGVVRKETKAVILDADYRYPLKVYHKWRNQFYLSTWEKELRSGDSFLIMLNELGVIDLLDNIQRVVISAYGDDVCRVFVQRVGDEDLLKLDFSDIEFSEQPMVDSRPEIEVRLTTPVTTPLVCITGNLPTAEMDPTRR